MQDSKRGMRSDKCECSGCWRSWHAVRVSPDGELRFYCCGHFAADYRADAAADVKLPNTGEAA